MLCFQAEKTNTDKVDLLMEHIMKDLNNKYEPLLAALEYTNQGHVVAILQEASSRPPSENHHKCKEGVIKN